MNTTRNILLTLLCLSLLAPLLSAQVRLEAQGSNAETTLADQTDVAVTVYNNNRALVRDRRKLELPKGTLNLKFMDVAQRIQPETVSLKSRTAPGSIQILEQNYEYDLMSPEKLMEKYVGRNVKLINKDKQTDFFEVDAKLLSLNNGPIYQIGGEIYLGHPGTVVLPEIPEALIAKPTLIWTLDNAREKQEIEATYLTSGLSWKADYVLTLDREEKFLDLDGWITLDNQSGATYANAQLKLVAGDVNIVRTPQPMMEMRTVAYAAKAVMPREESFGEYHLYTLPRRTTVKQNQSKQVTLLTADQISVEKKYEYRGQSNYYFRRMPPRENDHLDVFLEFQNEAKNNLGLPLPAGIMRVYQPDSEGMLQFSGEDRIQHTPKDEKVRLRLGNAFDVIGERTQTDYRKTGANSHEAAFKIVIRNHKESAISADLIEPMIGDWRITQASQDHVKKNANTAVFTVEVPKDGEATVTYRVSIRQ